MEDVWRILLVTILWRRAGAEAARAMLLILAQVVLLPLLTAYANVDEKPAAGVKIVLAGDSTVAPNGGWGPAFAGLLQPDVQCVNLARGGRSSKSFRDEGHWKSVLEQKPNYVLIQFGHNDMPGKGPERETDPKTTYSENMARYVDEVRAAHAIPILITSMTRRRFTPEGRIQSDLIPYVEAVKEVAARKQVPLVDLHARSIEMLDRMGPTAAVALDKASTDPAKPDRTHLSEQGGEAMARLVADELRRVVPEFERYLTAGTKADLVVAADGSGDYRTVQEAVDAVPAGNQKRFVIAIKPGVYKAHLVIPKEKPFITLRGEDAEKTLLTNDRHVKTIGEDGKEVGTQGSASTFLSAADFHAENLTFENNAPHVAQALAIYVQADRVVFRNCRFLGWQDTIRVRSGRQYFDRCYINGRTDFIYGEATSFFDRCHIHVLEPGWITAANTPETQPFGLVFSRCRITAEPGVKTYLGRPWRQYAQVVWLDTEMDDVIRPEGWHNWNKPEAEKTVRYAEYGSKTPDGKLIDLNQRVSWSRRLTEEEARTYTLSRVLGGADQWNPLQ